MLVTSERAMLVDFAENLAKMILNSDIAEKYRNCFDNLKNNKESQRKIQQFSKLKEIYEDAQRFGRYHPDYKRIMLQIREAKREMDLDPHVAEFKLAENDLQGLLDEISIQLGLAVSKNVKVPTGNPFFETGSSCNGSCGGGNCGCSA